MKQKSFTTAQLSGRQSLCQDSSVKSTNNGNHAIAKLSTYLKTRDGLWRLLACFPGSMPVEQAILQAPKVFTKASGKEGRVC